ncbi:AsmA family protein [bacterium]|nr:AsmA family protein [bacterium]
MTFSRNRGAAFLRTALRTLLLGLGVLLALVLILLVALRFIFPPDTLKGMVEERLSRATGRTVSVESAGFTVLRGLSISASGIRVGEDPRYDSPYFVQAERFYLRLKLLPLLARRIEVRSLLFVRPEVYLVRDRGGVFNFKSLAGSDTTAATEPGEKSSGAGFAFLLAAASVEQARLHYRDLSGETPVVLDAGPLDLQLKLDESRSRQRLALELILEGLSTPGASWGVAVQRSLPLKLNLGADVDPSSGTVAIDHLEAELAGVLLEGGGRVSDYRAALPECSLTWKGQVGDLGRAATLLPPGLIDSLGLRITQGELELSGQLTINPGGQDSLDWSLSADITNAKAELAGLSRPLGGIDTRLTLRRGELRVEKLDATFGLDPVSVSGRVGLGGATTPWEAKLKTSLRLDDLPVLVPALEGWTSEGQLQADLALSGVIEKPAALSVSGRVSGNDIYLSGPSLPQRIGIPTLSAEFAGQDIPSLEARVRAGESDLTLKASLSGFPALWDEKASAGPLWTAEFSGPMLNIFDFVASDSLASAEKEKARPEGSAWVLPLALSHGSGAARLDRLVLSRYFDLQNAALAFSVRDSLIELQNLSAELYGGRVEGRGSLGLGTDGVPRFEVQVDALSLVAGQAVSPLASIGKYMSGRIDTRIKLSGKGLDTEKILSSLSGAGEYMLSDGTVSGWPFLGSLAAFSGMGELDSLPFKQWGGKLVFENGRVHTDNLSLSTSAGDWSANGSFGFDGSLDYALRLHLNESLSTKYRAKLPGEIASLLSDSDRRIELGFKISGSADKPKFKWDSAPVRQRVQEKVQDALGRQIDKLFSGSSKKASADSAAPADSATPKQKDALKKGAQQLINNLFKKKKSADSTPTP